MSGNSEKQSVEMITSTGMHLPTVELLRERNFKVARRILSSNELIHGEPNALREQAEAVQKRVRARESKG